MRTVRAALGSLIFLVVAVGGLYRYVRNPMYLAIGATIAGQALILGQPILLL